MQLIGVAEVVSLFGPFVKYSIDQTTSMARQRAGLSLRASFKSGILMDVITF